MNKYGDCSFCGGDVEEKKTEYDYRRRSHLLVINDVPTGVCRQCGEKYFKAHTLKRLDQVFHNVFDRHQKPDHVLQIPAVFF